MTRSHFLVFVLLACVQFPRMAPAQGLTGTLIGTVKDGQGGVLRGAIVRVTSPALIGGELTTTTDEKASATISQNASTNDPCILRTEPVMTGARNPDIAKARFMIPNAVAARLGATSTLTAKYTALGPIDAATAIVMHVIAVAKSAVIATGMTAIAAMHSVPAMR